MALAYAPTDDAAIAGEDKLTRSSMSRPASLSPAIDTRRAGLGPRPERRGLPSPHRAGRTARLWDVANGQPVGAPRAIPRT